MFQKNVGGADKVARIILGLALIAFALLAPESITWKALGFIGIVPLATAFMGFCPAYLPFKINTCKK